MVDLEWIKRVLVAKPEDRYGKFVAKFGRIDTSYALKAWRSSAAVKVLKEMSSTAGLGAACTGQMKERWADAYASGSYSSRQSEIEQLAREGKSTGFNNEGGVSFVVSWKISRRPRL